MRDANTQSGYDPAVVEATLERLLAHANAPARARLVGVSGLPRQRQEHVHRAARPPRHVRRRVGVEVMSLDDFYLGRRERGRLARSVQSTAGHARRPGHARYRLLQRTLDALGSASAQQPARLPRFDKGRDTRIAPSRWRSVSRAPALIVLEGWCIGVPAQSDLALRRPLNALERDEDAHARWRRWVNARLADDYARLWRRLDTLVLLQAPSFAVVSRWRDQQEQALRPSRRAACDGRPSHSRAS